MSCDNKVYGALVLRAHTPRKWSIEEMEDMIEALQQYRTRLEVKLVKELPQ